MWVTSPETQRQTNTERSIFLIRLWALSSDYRPIWQTGEKDSWVEGQLVTTGGFWHDFFISRCQGPLTHGHTQPAWTHTVTTRTVWKQKQINTRTYIRISSKWRSGTSGLGYTLRQPLNSPYDHLAARGWPQNYFLSVLYKSHVSIR